MKISLSLFVSLFLLKPLAWSEPRIEFRTSKPHALVNFMETAAGDPHRSETLRRIFENSPKNDPAARTLIAEFREARRVLDASFTFDGYPVSRHMMKNISDLFLVDSIIARTMNDFMLRTLGLMPVSDHERLFAVIRKFEPVYDSLIWNSNADKIRSYIDELEIKTKKWSIDDFFRRAALFFGSRWPKNVPFIVSLYPIPGDQGHSAGQSLGSVLSVGVLVDEKDQASRFGVIFHEICHALYEAQSKGFQKDFEDYFLSSQSKYAPITYQSANEALATAIGNGWVYEKISGKADPQEWYDDTYVDGFAKAIYPEVKSYLEQDRTFDRALAVGLIAKYESLFPDSIYTYDTMLDKIFLMTDGHLLEGADFRELFSAKFSVSSIFRNTPIDHDTSIENFKKSKETAFIAFSEKGKRQIEKLAASSELIAKNLDSLMTREKDFVFTSVDAKGRGYIIVKAEDKAGFDKALKALRDAKRLDRGKPFLY